MVSNTTLDVLGEFLESLADDGICLEDYDVQLAVSERMLKIVGKANELFKYQN